MNEFIDVFLRFISPRYLQADVDKAVAAARKAFNIDSPWRKYEPATRGNLMRKLCALLRRDVDYLSVRFRYDLFLAFNKYEYLEIRNTQ